MSFSNYVEDAEFVLTEKEDIYPQLNPVTMEDVILHMPPDIDKIDKMLKIWYIMCVVRKLKSSSFG
jgi:hypothetical protein